MLDSVEHLLDTYASGRISRRDAALKLLGLGFASLAGAPRAASAQSPTFQATGLNHLGIRVSDVERSRDFYQRHLGLSMIRDNTPGNCFMRAGNHYIGLFRSGTPGIDHFCFTVDGYEADRSQKKLEAAGLASRRDEDRVYFDDPDGLEVQLDSRFGSWPGPKPPEAD